MVHGDDFTFAGTSTELDKVTKALKGWHKIKERGVFGSGVGESKEMVILGRTVRWTSSGIELEADGRHRKTFMEQFGLIRKFKDEQQSSA